MSFHKRDWLKLLGGAGLALTGAGMFAGAGPLAALFTEGGLAGAEGATATGLGTAGASGELGASGMFAQVPGVSAGSQQAAMLAAQNEGFGGAAANATAQAAMPAVNAARASGQMGLPQYLLEGAKGQLAGVNDPSVLAQRAMTNLQRMGGGAARTAATSVAMNGLAPQPYQPQQPMMPRPQASQGGGEDLNSLMQRAQQGDPIAMQKVREMMQQMGMA